MDYQHSQSQPVLAYVLAIAAVGATVAAVVAAEPILWVAPACLAFAATVGFALSTLTTTVTAHTVTTEFRWGRPTRVIALDDIVTASPVRNSWLVGWGIRYFSGTTMHNVWGLDAVHLDLGESRDFRIGTDDPEGLAAAINASP